MSSTTREGSELGVLLNTIELVEVVEGLEGDLLAEDVPLDEVGKESVDLVRSVLAGRDTEDVVELLESELLSLRKEEEDHDKGSHVESGVESESTLSSQIYCTGMPATDKLTVGVMAATIRGQVRPRTPAQKRQVATAHPIPTSR